MRRHSDLSFDQLQRIADSKRVPCPYPPCARPVDEQCVNTSDTTSRGKPLGGLGAHVDRLMLAQRAPSGLAPGTPAPAPATRTPALV